MTTKTTTPAEIPAENIAAHHTEYVPTLALTEIQPHPKNIRHDAAADAELVGSIRTQGLLEPLLVAPHPDPEAGGYVLIAGHRRLDGLLQAGHTSAPVLIRYDLIDEGDQVAAMLVENGRRADLTPIEEAEGFDLLTEKGWKVERIANATGYSKSTVTARRKLTALKPTFQEQVSAGQVTLEDALAIAALPEAEQKRLETQTPSSLQYELRRSQERVRRTGEVLKEIADLKKLGAAEQTMPKGAYLWGLTDAEHGLTPLTKLPGDLRYASGHTGCLAWINTGTAQYPGIDLVCTNVSRHDDEVAAAQAEAIAGRTEEEKAEEAERAAREEERQKLLEEQRAVLAEIAESRRVAAQLRADVILGDRGVLKAPPAALAPVIRMATITMLDEIGIDDRLYEILANVPEDHRWAGSGAYYNHPGKLAHKAAIAAMAPSDLWRAFVSVLLAHLEGIVNDVLISQDAEGDHDPTILAEYLGTLTTIGHQATPVDDQLAGLLAGGGSDTEEQTS